MKEKEVDNNLDEGFKGQYFRFFGLGLQNF